MPCNYFLRLSGTLRKGGWRSISGQDSGVQAQIEVLTGLGKSLLGNSRLTCTVPSETFTDKHVFVQPRMVAAGQANLHNVNQIKNLPVFGAVSSASSFVSLLGPSFLVCGYHVDCLLSEPSQVTVGVNPQKVFMAVCGSRLSLAECSTNNLISRRMQPGVAAYHSFTCGKRSSGNYRNASLSFRSKEQPNNFLIYGYFMHNVVKNPHRRFCFEGFHISVYFSARSAPNVSIDNSVCQEQQSSSVDSSKLEIPTGRTLKLNSGSCYLPHPDKEETGGEDAHFICMDGQAIGVADGVGGWADIGVDSGQYARELMSNSVCAIQEEPSGSIDPARVLEKAYIRTKSRGSSTACIIALTEQGLHAINLGDSGFMVVRDGCTVFRSPVQQHDFNYPYQLESDNGGDLPSSGQINACSGAAGVYHFCYPRRCCHCWD
ncbi:probable protein phosphatase 2C 55 isoform X4 [Olea europaea var. sylvestris]|uniref:probable protein phosphatase 2C 55 isoform X4 n=1 Tax=Olea europaea var. sylvestris TaxID=158386 RepID=UPI000C1CD0EB|nr:probable protein phosphatase 2C 55 isoform X4 [Olea europaea var. sylvestris]